MPLKGKQLVVYPCKTLWRGLNFAPNHNPSMEKWWVTHLQDLRIWSLPAKGSKWVWKEANLIILLWWMQKLGQMKMMRMREKPLLWLLFLHGQISDQPNNVITQPITVSSPNHPQNPSSNQPQGMLAYRTPNAQTPPLAKTKKEFCSKKPVGFTPNFGIIC